MVDQWEELYTLVSSDDENQLVKAFIEGLLEACAAGKLKVVLTLRGDFMGHATSFRPLSDRLQNAQLNLGPMTPAELQQVIEAPAAKLNSGFEPGLADRLLSDVGEAPGNLPLLEFVLEALWLDEKRRGGLLRHQAYNDMHGLKGALAQKADNLYKQLPNDHDRKQLRHILLQLVQSGENADYTRRRASFDSSDPQTTALIQQLIAQRLLVGNRDGDSNSNTLEVAHEALIRDWPQFQAWLRQDRDFLLWRERLRNAMQDWQESRDRKAYLQGQRLTDAKRWLKLQADDLTQAEQRFIRDSSANLKRAWAKTIALVLLCLSPLAGFVWWSAGKGLSPQEAWYALLAKYDVYIPEPDMLTIPPDRDCAKPACEFMMGSPEDANLPKEEKPPHRVSFNKAFKISRYEITFHQYQVFAVLEAEEHACVIDGKPHQIGPVNDSGWGKGQQPAIYVSWEDAQCYVQWLNRKTGKRYHLPSEAQWEFAARAGTSGDYSWVWENPDEFAWFVENSGARAHPVGGRKPNPFGLYDTSGNVMEWVEDCWHENYRHAPIDGKAWLEQDQGDCGRRVLRGGASWFKLNILRSATRFWRYSGYRNDEVGFRLAQD
jgi:formylglycine-generating enzyme required for sulfatase activity